MFLITETSKSTKQKIIYKLTLSGAIQLLYSLDRPMFLKSIFSVNEEDNINSNLAELLSHFNEKYFLLDMTEANLTYIINEDIKKPYKMKKIKNIQTILSVKKLISQQVECQDLEVLLEEEEFALTFKKASIIYKMKSTYEFEITKNFIYFDMKDADHSTAISINEINETIKTITEIFKQRKYYYTYQKKQVKKQKKKVKK